MVACKSLKRKAYDWRDQKLPFKSGGMETGYTLTKNRASRFMCGPVGKFIFFFGVSSTCLVGHLSSEGLQTPPLGDTSSFNNERLSLGIDGGMIPVHLASYCSIIGSPD